MRPPQPFRCPQCSAPIMYGYTPTKVLVAVDRQVTIEGDVLVEQNDDGLLLVSFTSPGRGKHCLHKCSYDAKTRTEKKPAQKKPKPQKDDKASIVRERQAVDLLLEACEAQNQPLADWLQARIEAIRASRGYLN